MFPPDSLFFDVILPASARPTSEQVIDGLGGEEVARNRLIVDVDIDLPQIETEISPSFLFRRRGDRRVFIVDEASAPLRASRNEPLVARDLRPERDRLARFVEKTGARIGRMGTFGTWGDAVWVTRTVRDLRALALLAWALDPILDMLGRRRAQPLGQRETETKLSTFDKRLDELADAAVLARVPPARLEKRGPKDNPVLIVDTLSDLDGSWDIRLAYELEKRVGAVETFSRIPGARQNVVAPEPTPAPAGPPAPPPPAAPPRPAGPPLAATDHGGRLLLRIPGERFDSELITMLGKRPSDAVGPSDQISRRDRDRIEQEGGGFIAPLAFLSEVFLEGKPLDKRRFAEEAREITGGARALEAHLPRYGAVRVIELDGKRWITSELAGDDDALLRLLK